MDRSKFGVMKGMERIYQFGRRGGIGDVLMCTPAIKAFKCKWPGSKVVFYAAHPELVRGLPYIDEVRSLDDPPDGIMWFSYENRPNTGFHIAELFGEQLSIEIGNARPDCIFNTKIVDHFKEVWRFLPRPWILINRHSSGFTPNKDWPDVFWDKLILNLKDKCTLIEIGVKHNASRPSVASLASCVDLRGSINVEEFIAAIAASDVHVGPISGPVHVAAAAGTPSVVIYGGYEHPAATNYEGNVSLYTPLKCAPCGLNSPCPYEKQCLSTISVDVVETAIWTIWDRLKDAAMNSDDQNVDHTRLC